MKTKNKNGSRDNQENQLFIYYLRLAIILMQQAVTSRRERFDQSRLVTKPVYLPIEANTSLN